MKKEDSLQWVGGDESPILEKPTPQAHCTHDFVLVYRGDSFCVAMQNAQAFTFSSD